MFLHGAALVALVAGTVYFVVAEGVGVEGGTKCKLVYAVVLFAPAELGDTIV